MNWLCRLCLLLIVPLVSVPIWAGDAHPFIIAVHPYLPKDEITSRYKPLADLIGNAIGRKVEVRVGRSYEEHIDAIGHDTVDMAYMGPVSYCKLVSMYGKKPLLARQVVDGKPLLNGEIVVRQNSVLQSVAQLKGKSFLFADVESTMGSVLPQKVMQKAGISLIDLSYYKFVEGHENVAMAVLAGSFDAGAVKEETFQKYAEMGLRSLAHLPAVYDHLFVTSNKVPSEQVEAIRALMLKLNDTAQGRQIMESIHPKMTAFVAVSDSDYDNLRTLLKKNK